jgi:hypothetical protein
MEKMKKEKKARRGDLSFIKRLIKRCIQLKKLKPREVYIFNIYTQYGNYQILIGPECVGAECKRMHVKPHSRKLEINGSMHHLFVNPKNISPLPRQEDVKVNLRGSVIMKDVVIHIVDQDGSGAKIKIEKYHSSTIKAEQKINLAGKSGDVMIQDLYSSGRLAKDTYKIIQEDILEALKKHR